MVLDVMKLQYQPVEKKPLSLTHELQFCSHAQDQSSFHFCWSYRHDILGAIVSLCICAEFKIMSIIMAKCDEQQK
jgi:hypothetical protein